MTGSTAADISGLYAMLGRQEGSMIPGNHDNGSRHTKTREMAKDYLARAGRRQNIRPGAFIHSGRKRPNPITAPPDRSHRFTRPPHAIPEPTGRAETAPRVILLRFSGTPPAEGLGCAAGAGLEESMPTVSANLGIISRKTTAESHRGAYNTPSPFPHLKT